MNAASSEPKLFSPLRPTLVWERFAIALATAALAVLLRWLLDPLLGHVAFYATLYMAVAFTAAFCGFVPGMVSAGLGFFGVFYWFIDPRHSLSLVSRADIHGVIGCIFVCIVLIALGSATRRKQLKLNDTVTALTSEARERSFAEQELQKANDQLERRVDERTLELSEAARALRSEVAVRTRTEEQLRRLTVRLLGLQDEERRRIARDLHDTTGQTLAALKMTATSIQRMVAGNVPQASRQMEDLMLLADVALREIRTTSYLLHPPMLEEAGIASAAQWFIEGFSQRSGIQVQCEITQDLRRPRKDCELVLFRLLQESLTNIHRHSGASTACVRLGIAANDLTLEISDDGAGIPEENLKEFNESNKTTGVGIAGMRERVRELGGRFEIERGQKGTIVRASLPVSRAYDAASEAAGSGVR
jgi:signal transduction histidine kinase